MINQVCFTKEWLNSVKQEHPLLKIKKQETDNPSVFHESFKKSDYLIPNDSKYNYLNKKLKNIPNGALFYWFHVVKMLEY